MAWDSAGSGPAVLLIMGLGGRGLAWRRVVEGLQQRFHLIWFDHRGVGDSGPPNRPVTMASLAADAVAVADAAGLQTFHLAGVSMGGMIAQHVALAYRDRVRSLALLATHPGGWRYRVPPLGAWRLWPAVRHRDPKVRLAALAQLLFPPAYLATVDDAALHRALAEEFGGGSLATLAGQVRAVAGHDTRDRLSQLAGLPVLVLQPGSDRLVRPQGSAALAASIPGARLVCLDAAGHGLVRQCAPELHTLLCDHWLGAAPA